MEINLTDKVMIERKDYQKMLRLLTRASLLLSTESLVDFDTYPRDKGTSLFQDIHSITRPFDDDSPIQFLTNTPSKEK